jgi:cytochrome c-type biogenesis protein
MIGELTFAAVFLAGVISFLSPCVLPLVPAYLTYMTGRLAGRTWPMTTRSAKLSRFLLDSSRRFCRRHFALVFVLLGATATQISLLLRQYSTILSDRRRHRHHHYGPAFSRSVWRWSLLYRQARMDGPKSTSGPGGALAMGLAFGFAWTPCIGPILGAVLGCGREPRNGWPRRRPVACLRAGYGFAVHSGCAFAVGPFTRFLGKFREHMQTMERATGALLVATGTAFLLGWHTILANWMLDRFPGLVALT